MACCGSPRNSPRICSCNSLGIRASSAALAGVKIIWNGVIFGSEAGAGEGNRTLVSALGRPHSTIEPHPLLRRDFYQTARGRATELNAQGIVGSCLTGAGDLVA